MLQSDTQEGIAAKEVSHTAKLNTTEIGNLWNNYVDSSMIMCILKVFSMTVEDPDIKELINEDLQKLDHRQNLTADIMKKESMPIPIGFSDADINTQAPRLYTDVFYLSFSRFCQRFDIPMGSLDFVTSTRSDVLDYYSYRITASAEFLRKITDVALNKGLYIRAPYATVKNEVDMVDSKKFSRGLLGKKRPLLAQEISSLYHLIQPNLMGKSMLTGFTQTTPSKQVRKYMEWGIKLTNKMIDTFSQPLQNESIIIPAIWDTMVTYSTTPLFSDKLMMHSVSLMNDCGMLNMAYVFKNSFRHDLLSLPVKIMPELVDFTWEGTKIRIENGWFEEPPITYDRRELINSTIH